MFTIVYFDIGDDQTILRDNGGQEELHKYTNTQTQNTQYTNNTHINIHHNYEREQKASKKYKHTRHKYTNNTHTNIHHNYDHNQKAKHSSMI